MTEKEKILSHYFGYSTFRRGQEEIIDSVLTGRDVLGVMPTGGGKSLCYQVPALMLDGITIVVSPLISLMKDQVMALKEAGINAAYINSSLSFEQLLKVYDNLKIGRYKIIYVAPERLETDGFLSALSYQTVSLVAVDEAHCISEWGQDFRPSYLNISSFLRAFPTRPTVAALTATATERVREDIKEKLNLKNPYETVTGFDRPNLFFDVRKPKKKAEELFRLLSERTDKSGIVYCSTRKQVDGLYEELNAKGYSATKYHAGLSEEVRHRNQDDFVYDRAKIMIATCAFGMGIDKSNVSFVIHYNMPKSLEEYYQEAGRAGRDGSPADCILLYSAGDIYTAKYLIENPIVSDEDDVEKLQETILEELARLEIMIGYAKTSKCYRGTILDYFGQEHESNCANCGNCTRECVTVDVTSDAQKILSCVVRIRNFLGYPLGTSLVNGVLRESKTRRISELNLNLLPTYGILKNQTHDEVQTLIDALIEKDLLRVFIPYQTLAVTEKGNDVLFRGARVEMSLPVTKQDTKPKENITKRKPSENGNAPELYEKLRDLRMRLAKFEDVPAYVIFSNKTLEEMAEKAPSNREELLAVTGVGTKKAEKYGKIFLDVINQT